MTSTPAPMASLTIGTRGSPLALAQTRLVTELLAAAWPGITCSIRVIETRGDRTQAAGEPLPEIGGKGLFTAELERALQDGEIDAATHSLKDLPTTESEGIVLGAVCAREDARDCVITHEGHALGGLGERSTVGTSSPRRAAQLRALRPDLRVQSVRGNVGTRVRKAREGEVDAVVVAAAGIRRLGLEDEVAEWLPETTMLPAPGQGALAVQCRAGDAAALAALRAVDNPGTRAATTAERGFLADLGAGCSAPVGAYARSQPDGSLHMAALVASLDGTRVVRVDGTGTDATELGARLARHARAGGASAILDEVRG
ncbi:MAG: hydroxymethylbilane synthase [Gaiellaceae bacterium]